MIITKKKPLEEVWQMLEGITRVALVGCGSCATSCKTGGEPELQEMKEYLESNGKIVTAIIIPAESCQKLLMKKELKALKDTETQAILTLACGDGVQTVADNANIPVYPATNTMFLGQVERVGLFSEACRMCGDCVLGHTGGICPITKCAKSLINGPCGGQKGGKCEVNPENNCAWIDIYYRLDALGQLDKLKTMRTDKDYKNFAYPRRISIREEK